MPRAGMIVGGVCLVFAAITPAAQTVRPVPRPPAQADPPRPEDGSAAPDGYAPPPQWKTQTRAPRPEKTAAFAIETVTDGLSGAFCFSFLPDGRIPQDNPFVGRAGAHPEIYAFGFRDVQGVTIHPRTGALWTSEHGPRGGDDINRVEKGRNYGFPVIGYGREYTGKPINGDRTAQDGMEQPVYFWTPDIAPAGIAFYVGKLFAEWQGNLFVSALAAKALVRLVFDGNRVVGEERLLTELDARIRGVGEGPDGALRSRGSCARRCASTAVLARREARVNAFACRWDSVRRGRV